MSNRRVRRIGTAALLAVALLGARTAAAETSTLAGGAMDLVGAPVDLALTPVTATTSFVRKFYVTGNRSAVQKVALTPAVGVVYLPACLIITGSTTVMRFVSGLVNIPMGLVALGSDKAPDTRIYEPIHGSPGALVDYKGIYFGGYHCEGFFQ
jgi:hypothetical protein